MSAWTSSSLRRGRGAGRRRAFTLMEMLVVLGIIAVVTALTIPLMAPFVRGRCMAQAVETVRGAVMRARYLAVESGQRYYAVFYAYNSSAPDGAHSKVEVWKGDPENGGTLAEDPLYIPDPVRLYLGSYPIANGRTSIAFASSGAAIGTTNAEGLFLVRDIGYSGKVGSAGDHSVTVSPSPAWPTDKWRESFLFVTGPSSSLVFGRARTIANSTANAVTFYKKWKRVEETTSPAAGVNDTFIIVPPGELRRLVVVSTTGRVQVEETLSEGNLEPAP